MRRCNPAHTPAKPVQSGTNTLQTSPVRALCGFHHTVEDSRIFLGAIRNLDCIGFKAEGGSGDLG